MKPGARMLLAEPSGQVSEAQFDTELEMAQRAGNGLKSVASIAPHGNSKRICLTPWRY
jgi:hypothetical protein